VWLGRSAEIDKAKEADRAARPADDRARARRSPPRRYLDHIDNDSWVDRVPLWQPHQLPARSFRLPRSGWR
jgi:hypothetical protein